MLLRDLAIKYGSDKVAEKHPYVNIYNELFAPIRDNEIDMLELGIGTGASLMMWLEYFPRIDYICGIEKTNHSNIKYFDSLKGVCDIKTNTNQGDWSTYFDWYEEGQGFDIIIDDCSHWTEYTIFSYFALRKLLAPQGLYIIEDCNYYRAKYTKEILGKYGEVRDCGKESMIIIRK